MITLCMTPLKDVTRSMFWLRFRRMFGLFAFFYVLLHFCVYLLLDQEGKLGALWQDIVKRPYITIGMLALRAAGAAGAHLHRQVAAPPGKALDPVASADLRDRAARRLAFLVAGQEGHPRAAAVRRGLALLLGYRAWKRRKPRCPRFSAARFARTDGA